MWPFSRWFKPQQARPPIAPPQAPASARTIGEGVRRPAPAVPPEALGLERIESRSRPGRYYYRNAIPPPLPGLPCIHGDAFFTYEVAGASYYQETLERIVGGRRSASVYFRAIAVLVAEPENPHDAHAIVVRINGEPVAHIKKEDNVSFRQQLDALGFSGDVQCRAEIEGGWDHGGGDIGKYGVKLDITFPLDVRPASKPRAPRKKH